MTRTPSGHDLIRLLSPRWLRNWMRNPAATRRWLASAWAWRHGQVAELDFTSISGTPWKLRCHPESGRTFRLFLEEEDSIAELRAFQVAVRPGMRLLDLGAHYGFFTLATLALGGEGAQALAVEPSVQASIVLRANLALAQPAPPGEARPPRLRALQAAVAPRSGTLRMLAAGVASENYMVAAPEPRPDATAVRACSLAELELEAGWSPTHVKLDIEGFECELLAHPDSLETLAAWRATLFLELHGDWIRARGHDPLATLRALHACGYRQFLSQGKAMPLDRLAAMPLARVLCLF